MIRRSIRRVCHLKLVLQVGEPPDEEGVQEGAADRGRVQAAEVRRVGEAHGPPREVVQLILPWWTRILCQRFCESQQNLGHNKFVNHWNYRYRSIWSRTIFCWHWNKSFALVCEVYTTAELSIWCQPTVFHDQMDHPVSITSPNQRVREGAGMGKSGQQGRSLQAQLPQGAGPHLWHALHADWARLRLRGALHKSVPGQWTNSFIFGYGTSAFLAIWDWNKANQNTENRIIWVEPHYFGPKKHFFVKRTALRIPLFFKFCSIFFVSCEWLLGQ